MRYKLILFLILGFDLLNLFYQASQLSISYNETNLLYGDFSILQFLIKISIDIFGQNDFALRLPIIISHILSVLLLYKLSQKYITSIKNRLWLVLIFILLPGVLSSAIIVDKAGLILFSVLLLICMYNNNKKFIYYPLIIFYAFLDNSYLYLFISLSIFALNKKDNQFLIVNIIAIMISTISYGIVIHGIPKGHFVDVLGLYAAIFSPIVFFYVIYALYKRLLQKDTDIIWYISVIPFIISLLLSFRQSIHIEHIAPYIIVSLPLVAQTFISSYRVRLRRFRSRYRLIFVVSFVILLFNALVVIFNKELYMVIDNPKKHFVYKFHIAKELAKKLKENGIKCVNSSKYMQKRLFFYGVKKCNKYSLNSNKNSTKESLDVTISYAGREVYSSNVTKINK